MRIFKLPERLETLRAFLFDPPPLDYPTDEHAAVGKHPPWLEVTPPEAGLKIECRSFRLGDMPAQGWIDVKLDEIAGEYAQGGIEGSDLEERAAELSPDEVAKITRGRPDFVSVPPAAEGFHSLWTPTTSEHERIAQAMSFALAFEVHFADIKDTDRRQAYARVYAREHQGRHLELAARFLVPPARPFGQLDKAAD